MGLTKNSKSYNQKNVRKSRKQLRKEMRKQKKQKRGLYMNRKKFSKNVLPTLDIEVCTKHIIEKPIPHDTKAPKQSFERNPEPSNQKNFQKDISSEQLQKKDRIKQKRLEKEMLEHRKKKLLDANAEEDRIIKQLEKKLGLNKRKSKTLPKAFKEDGLDYLMELCDAEGMKEAVAAEQALETANVDEFAEDFATILGKDDEDMDSKADDGDSTLKDENCEFDDVEEEEDIDNANTDDNEDDINSEDSGTELDSEDIIDSENSTEKMILQKKYETKDESDSVNNNKKRKLNEELCKKKKQKISDSSEEDTDDGEYASDASEASEVHIKGAVKINKDGTWEDIYGRLRAKDGSVISQKESKYVPPALRQDNSKQSEKLTRLRKQLKGLLNRLTESNMHSIATTIEDMYMNNSRNDMNESLTSLILDTLVTEITTPERLLIEHVVLLTVLHANVGTEIGAHFLQQVASKFDIFLSGSHDVENKMLDNITKIIAQLYNFQLFDSKLVYEMLRKFCEFFDEKCIECILHVLRSVGFNLRKDNPFELKNFIVEVQKKASEISEEDRDNCRVKFMLDILLAIRNNNVKKIPNYDVSYPEHLKKVMKGFIRKGNYVTQLNIGLEDLLKADEKGRWWVVGSAWSGNQNKDKEQTEVVKNNESYSTNILELARQQHMNTDTRRNIFCIIMSAEDYLDAFNKTLHLSLKNQQEREIVNVILHCCLRETKYNPYYSFLAQKFCDYDRKFQIMIKYAVWDKLKALQSWNQQISNLAKLLTHLFIEKGLVISVLKVVEFSELDKVTLRFIRQILIGILLHKVEEDCLQVFLKVSKSDKLKIFRDSLRLFIHHFLLKNLNSEGIPEEQKHLLEQRAKAVEKVLSVKESKW
ncbi:unnamed protein product [Acanthoscelides obtectus]|uniref:MI domain-containing protein n=1 Tax=Acanthoscelides obtectus TaxID=200917 RepID=A0A9P0LWU5_ACAOB|nr:unnamed protein product [Acanthoscelides obtectus]CAK1621994.1 Nucleolar MIF4G domain-containing protein 1 [Acanthoscelides obtectus]